MTPFADIEAAAARGSLMGNRGILHDDQGCLGSRRWQHQSWVACTLVADGPKRPLAAPGHYTALFFHDEAVALAAGHRPCAQCRRAAYDRFVSAWKTGHDIGPETFVPARTIDAALHQARVTRARNQVTHTARLGHLPAGVFVVLPDVPGVPCLLWNGHLHAWSHAGYARPQAAPADAVVTVLTPAPTVAVLRAGYVPAVLQPDATASSGGEP